MNLTIRFPMQDSYISIHCSSHNWDFLTFPLVINAKLTLPHKWGKLKNLHKNGRQCLICFIVILWLNPLCLYNFLRFRSMQGEKSTIMKAGGQVQFHIKCRQSQKRPSWFDNYTYKRLNSPFKNSKKLMHGKWHVQTWIPETRRNGHFPWYLTGLSPSFSLSASLASIQWYRQSLRQSHFFHCK